MINIKLNADDLGLTKRSTECIIELLVTNKIDTASLMTNMEYTNYAIELIEKNNLKDKINLHFNITQGKALSGISSLTDSNGIMYRDNKLKLNYIDFNDIVKEFELQSSIFPYFKNIDCHNNVNFKSDKLHNFLKTKSKYIRDADNWEEFNFKSFNLLNKKNNIYCHPTYKDDLEIENLSYYNKERYLEYLILKNISK